MAHRSRTPPRTAADQTRFRAPDEVSYASRTTGEPIVQRCTHAGKVKKRKIAVIGPTMFWLVHPHLNALLARFERFGAVRVVEAYLNDSDTLQSRYMESHAAYAAVVLSKLSADEASFFTAAYLDDAKPGSRKYGNAAVGDPMFVKCLHAQVASTLAGVPTPVGSAVVNYIITSAEAVKGGSAKVPPQRATLATEPEHQITDRTPATAELLITDRTPATAELLITDDFAGSFERFISRETACGRDPWTVARTTLEACDVSVAAFDLLQYFEGTPPKPRTKKHRVN